MGRLRNEVKQVLKSIPLVGPALRRASVAYQRLRFRNSGDYWERRYTAGGTSGDGSYGALAQFKARFLSDFIKRSGARRFIEFGCGDGSQLAMINYPSYLGLDIAQTIVARNRRRFAGDKSKRFDLFDAQAHMNVEAMLGHDVALSLDVLFHLVEDDVYEAYMRCLFGSAKAYVIIYSSDSEECLYPSLPHVRARKFSDWISVNQPGWELVEHVANEHPFDPATGEGSLSEFFVYRRQAST